MIILEQCRIGPSDTPPELSLPLTHFDMFWPDFFPIRELFLYDFPCSKPDFINRIIPKVKHSLSSALKHFPPFSGNFLHPMGPGTPEIQYRNGDSISLIFAESDDDFSCFSSNQPRNAEKFYSLLPELPPVVHVAGARLVPLLAVQVTLFPNLAVSVGLTNQHVAADARALLNFIKSWALICRNDGDEEFLADKSRHPVYDRCLINDPNKKLFEKGWNYLRKAATVPPPPISLADRVRATFVVEDAKIEKLKILAAKAMDPDADRHLSTFTVICGYAWSCLAQSGADIGEEEGIEHFFFPADYRSRLDPPLPGNYFGNCLGFFFLKSPRSRLIGEGGFLAAEKLIGEAIEDRFYRNKDEIMKSAENWVDGLEAMDWSRMVGVAGAPSIDFYDVDFGWGRPEKFESMAIDAGQFVFLCKLKDSEQDLEVGLSLPKIKMDAFAKIFRDGLGI